MENSRLLLWTERTVYEQVQIGFNASRLEASFEKIALALHLNRPSFILILLRSDLDVKVEDWGVLPQYASIPRVLSLSRDQITHALWYPSEELNIYDEPTLIEASIRVSSTEEEETRRLTTENLRRIRQSIRLIMDANWRHSPSTVDTRLLPSE